MREYLGRAAALKTAVLSEADATLYALLTGGITRLARTQDPVVPTPLYKHYSFKNTPSPRGGKETIGYTSRGMFVPSDAIPH